MNYIIRTVKIDELERLNILFTTIDNEQFMNERIEKIANRDMDIYIIECNKKFIGEVTIVYNKADHSDYTIPNKRVYMEAFRVVKEYQGKGVGQYLLKYVIEKVKEQGYSEITIGVEDDNENAKHIYSKFGFTEFIRRDHGNKYDPCDYNVYLKRLV
jgi:ribosomal protein S18 acetylase RimI-like enzyme